jgi:dihydroorotase
MKITLNSPLDMHLHLRDEDMLNLVAPHSAKSFSGGIIMPNIVPQITSKDELLSYKSRIKEAIKNSLGDEEFECYMTLFFKEYSKEFLVEVKDEIIALKLYPAGVTTNSDGGVKEVNIDHLRPMLEVMSELNIPLSIHGETNGEVMDRELEFLDVYETIAKSFPNLKIMMEHITTKEAGILLDKYDNLFATITAHHLLITIDDVIGGMLNPHLFCKPIAKTKRDQKMLLKLALNAHPKVMFGSDSAPHQKCKKETMDGSAGIYSAPIALPLLAELFDKHGKLDNLQAFISSNAQKIYGVNPPSKLVTLEKKPMTIPSSYKDNGDIEVVPMFAGKEIAWSVV